MYNNHITTFFFIVILVSSCLCGTADQWKKRTIYQIVTDRFSPNTQSSGCSDLTQYCGGTWAGITQNLPYIQQMGFDAIWISPIPKNVPSTNYHGYAAQDIYQVDPHFGSSQDLINMVNACHSRGIWVMLDVVPNHMGIPYPDNQFSQLYPFNQASHYHSCDSCPSKCWIADFNNVVQTQTCRLSGLPDLNQTNPVVKNILNSWVQNITKYYGIDGVRVDACAEMDTAFLSSFQSAVGMYGVGEVANADPKFVASYQGPLSGTLHYPMFFLLRSVFLNQNSLYDLQGEIKNYKAAFSNLDYLALFADNHDQIRFLNQTTDYKLYQNALTFVLMGQGIPIIYYGSEQGFTGGNDPYNREPLWPSGFKTSNPLYKVITTLISARKAQQIWNYSPVELLVDPQFYSFSRNLVFVALTNVGSSNAQISRKLTTHPYSNGQKLCNIFYPTEDCFTVNGAITIYLNAGESKVYVPA